MTTPTISINGVDLGTLGFRVSEPRGIWNTPIASSESIVVPGRAGQLVPQASMVALASRTIDIVGTLRGSSRADFLAKLDILKALRGAALTVILDEAPGRQYTARLLSATLEAFGPVFLQQEQPLTLSLFCDDPYAYDTTLQVVAFAVATAVPQGTAPTRRGIITITGAVVNPVITYKNAAGVTIETLGFTRTLAGGDTLTIDLDQFLVTRTVGGVPTNDLNALTSGDFFQLSPLDGDYGASSWPTLQVSGGTGSISYRRAYQ
jgi:phage-related protein